MKACTEWKFEQFRLNPKRHCRYCGKRLTVETATVDHIRPKSKGGRNRPRNFSLACWECNQKKDDRWKDDKPPLDPYAPDPWWPAASLPPQGR